MARIITAAQLARISQQPENNNMRSLAAGLAAFPAGLNAPHRLAHFLAQIGHESAGFRYDREVWGKNGGTPAQKRYDTRTDLGNTKAADGDGYLFRGRTAMQITGKANTQEFRDWCRGLFGASKVPDFVAAPGAMNTDPWEGLGPVWYWSTRDLNKYADANNPEMITRRINGGMNGYVDRLDWYTRAALVLLDRPPTDVIGFQKSAGLLADGVSGPATREALHERLRARKPIATGWASVPEQEAQPKRSGVLAFIAELFRNLAIMISHRTNR